MNAQLPARGAVDVWCVRITRAEDARRALRTLLAGLLDTTPAALPVSRTPSGKPVLRSIDLHFNLSHARTLALIAVSRDSAVGVDVEDLPSSAAAARVARRFHPAEKRRLAALPARERRYAFAELWAAKEAYLKFTGEGLARRLDSVVVSRDAEGRFAVRVGGAKPRARLHAVPVGPDAAAFVVASPNVRLGAVRPWHVARSDS